MPLNGQGTDTVEQDKEDDRDFDRESNRNAGRERDGQRQGTGDMTVVIEDETESRPIPRYGSTARSRNLHNALESGSFEKSCVVVPENEIEAQRISNNYKFGMKKWKSHVTSRPLTTRSEIIQDLYSDISKVKPTRISTFRPFNIVYTVCFGWWIALMYIIVGSLMFVTFIGRDYGHFCYRMARYFVWPFGKFVHQVHEVPLDAVARTYKGLRTKDDSDSRETESLLNNSTNHSAPSSPIERQPSETASLSYKCDWPKPETYLWLLLGIPVLWPIHALVWFITWFFVVSIPIAKVNSKMLLRILFMSPCQIQVVDQSTLILDPQERHSEIMMYTHQAVNWYYYKLTVDGVNVILVNLLLFVVLSIVVGYADADNIITDGVTKCILGVLAIIPLTYYVGMAITSISAQSNFAVGAILNATFGSMVEVILFIIMLEKGHASGQECYQELVKSSLTGAILVSILFIPGMSMVVGGLKFRTQNFNPKSANISAALLFVSIAGVFSPTIYAMLYGHMECEDCEPTANMTPVVTGNDTGGNGSAQTGFHCKTCTMTVISRDGDRSLYDSKVAPLIYCCAIILPVAYIVGLMFTMKTHSSEVYDEFETQLKEDLTDRAAGRSHGSAQWSRAKSIFILLLCATAIALCGDLIAENIQPLLEKSKLSEYFIGVTMLSLVAELPEVVNGIQFALQNNVNLGIEIGSSTAIQVCLVQIPMLVLIDLIYPMGFHLIFAEVHFWAVIFSVIVINYIFQDGKSDYFQGSIVVFIYLLLMVMYVFSIPPDNALCYNEPVAPENSTVTTLSPPSSGL